MDSTERTGPRSLAVGLVAAVAAIAALGALTALAAPERRESVVAVAPDAPGASAAPVRLSGALNGRGELTAADLGEFGDRTLDVTFQSSRGEQKHSYAGPLLYDVLMAAEPRFDPANKNDALRFSVLVRAEDGYDAVLAWGELEPKLANTEVLLAHAEDGTPLDRLRLIVPSDEFGGRYVSDVTETVVLRLSPELVDGPAGEPTFEADPNAPAVGHG